jgi:hemerythrin-like domain-containing protein
MNALDLLIADHNRVRGLFKRYRSQKEGENEPLMLATTDKIFTELEVHTTIEEEIFYPFAHDVTEGVGETVNEGIQEHHVAKVLMKELAELTPGADDWVAKMAVLIENVERHALEEESEMFPPIRSHVSSDRFDDIAERLESRKAELGAPTLADKIDLTKDEGGRAGRSSM